MNVVTGTEDVITQWRPANPDWDSLWPTTPLGARSRRCRGATWRGIPLAVRLIIAVFIGCTALILVIGPVVPGSWAAVFLLAVVPPCGIATILFFAAAAYIAISRIRLSSRGPKTIYRVVRHTATGQLVGSALLLVRGPDPRDPMLFHGQVLKKTRASREVTPMGRGIGQTLVLAALADLPAGASVVAEAASDKLAEKFYRDDCGFTIARRTPLLGRKVSYTKPNN